MMARYGTIQRSWWRRSDFRALTEDQRAALFYIRSTPHALSLPGVVVGGLAVHADELGWPVKRLAVAFDVLIAVGWAKADLDARLIWLPDMVDDDPPRNPNTVRSWGRVWPEVPDCSLKWDVWSALQRFREQFQQLSPEQFDQLFPQPAAQRFADPSPGPSPGPGPDPEIPPSPQRGEAQAALVLVPPATDAPKRRLRKRSSEPTAEEFGIVERVIAKLNERSGREFEASSKETQRLIVRLLRDGRSEHDLRLVVWDRANEWADDPEKAEWLRPSTLFGPEKFSDRLAEAKAKWAAAERADDLREHNRRKSAPVSPIVASLLEGGDLPFEHVRKPEPKRDVRVGRVEPHSADEYNRIAAEGGEF